jgi:acetate kinase
MQYLTNIMMSLKSENMGFHGTSHKYVSQRIAELLGKKPET